MEVVLTQQKKFHSNQLLFQVNKDDDIEDIIDKMIESWNKKEKLNTAKPKTIIVSNEEVLDGFDNKHNLDIQIKENRPGNYIYLSAE